jgi:DNA-binding transcriptional MerR regulator
MSVFRPLPAYDGSIGPLPATDVTNDDLLKRYGITKPTLFKRRDALVENGWVTPQKIGTRVYYSAQDVHLLDCCNYWSKNAYTIPEIVAHLRNENRKFVEDEGETDWVPVGKDEETIEVSAENSTTDLVVRGLQTSAKDLQMLGDEFVEKFAKRVGEAVKQAVPRDVLAAHDFLSKAADRNYLLTGKILAEGLGFRSSTIHGWDDEVDKFGFRIKRIGKGQWRVRALTDEEVMEAEERERNTAWINIKEQGKVA